MTALREAMADLDAQKLMRAVTSVFEAHCPCGENFVSEDNYQVYEEWRAHIEKTHPAFFEKLKARGRMLARGQNGCGYYDCDEMKETDHSLRGWWASQDTFRQAWITHALKDVVRWGKL